MNILITGKSGLAQALTDQLSQAHAVTQVSRGTGKDINHVQTWGVDFLEFDCVYNCAYDGIGQQLVLEYFYHHWQYNANKKIITIGSKIITQPRIEPELDRTYWPYRIHKQSLQNMHDAMWPTAKCDLKIINPGPLDTDMIKDHDIPKMPTQELAMRVVQYSNDPTIKRVDLWL